MHRTFPGKIYPGECPGELSRVRNVSGNVRGGCLDPLQDCKSLCVAVTICVTLVNTQTHSF